MALAALLQSKGAGFGPPKCKTTTECACALLGALSLDDPDTAPPNPPLASLESPRGFRGIPGDPRKRAWTLGTPSGKLAFYSFSCRWKVAFQNPTKKQLI